MDPKTKDKIFKALRHCYFLALGALFFSLAYLDMRLLPIVRTMSVETPSDLSLLREIALVNTALVMGFALLIGLNFALQTVPDSWIERAGRRLSGLLRH